MKLVLFFSLIFFSHSYAGDTCSFEDLSCPEGFRCNIRWCQDCVFQCVRKKTKNHEGEFNLIAEGQSRGEAVSNLLFKAHERCSDPSNIHARAKLVSDYSYGTSIGDCRPWIEDCSDDLHFTASARFTCVSDGW